MSTSLPSQNETTQGRLSQHRIYDIIKHRIVNCEILPGHALYEDHFAEEFGTSRTPVREALLKLRNDGLVSILPRKGTFISQITVQSVYEIYQLRRLLEPGVGTEVKDHVDSDRLAEFRGIFERIPFEQELLQDWFRFDREFHTYLVECTGNGMLLMLYEYIMNHQQRVSILAAKQPLRLQETAKEHAAIIDALLDKDDARITTAILAHIRASWDASLRVERIYR